MTVTAHRSLDGAPAGTGPSNRAEKERLPEVALVLTQALPLAERPVEHDVFTGASAATLRMFESRPVKTAGGVRIARGCKACPVAADGIEEGKVLYVKDVVRRRPEVVPEDEVSVESMNHQIADNRLHLPFERIQVDGSACPFDQPCDSARLADSSTSPANCESACFAEGKSSTGYSP